MTSFDERKTTSGEVSGVANAQALHPPASGKSASGKVSGAPEVSAAWWAKVKAAEDSALPVPVSAPPVSVGKPFNQTKAGAERLLPLIRLGDLEGKCLTIHSVEDFVGQFGPGYRVIVTQQSTGERGVLLGHWTVIGKYLERLQADGDLPVSVRVVKAAGKRYFDFDDPLQPATSLDNAETNQIPF